MVFDALNLHVVGPFRQLACRAGELQMLRFDNNNLENGAFFEIFKNGSLQQPCLHMSMICSC